MPCTVPKGLHPARGHQRDPQKGRRRQRGGKQTHRSSSLQGHGDGTYNPKAHSPAWQQDGDSRDNTSITTCTAQTNQILQHTETQSDPNASPSLVAAVPLSPRCPLPWGGCRVRDPHPEPLGRSEEGRERLRVGRRPSPNCLLNYSVPALTYK